MSARGQDLVVQGYASEPLVAGAVVPSLTAHNIVDRPRVVAALQAAFDRLGSRPRRVALVIPDVAARVSLLRFEQVPVKREDLDQLVRWQLKKSAPFPVDDACVTYNRRDERRRRPRVHRGDGAARGRAGVRGRVRGGRAPTPGSSTCPR